MFIFKIIIVIFGLIEIMTNGYYLFGKDKIMKAKLQHRELPEEITILQLKLKVMLMFLSGCLFLITGIASFFKEKEYLLFLSLIFFNLYALCETLYYRYWKVFGFFIVSIFMTLIYIFLRS
ncbi:hypothetical protein JCM16776_0331 [Leptotrichia shahii]|uniref:Uncharacterized protein n=1 Tax=Leptotrichia shahii TaxID=157691 RepID=A0A510JLB3_9FUSO|nr:hypothetical protein [Leptotrichia shahii]BBM40118.1 hypothetical protein JCM16776_0331 [Leptotrichia shahii]